MRVICAHGDPAIPDFRFVLGAYFLGVLAIKLLAIETATEACSAAVWCDGQVCERYALAARAQGRLILGMVDAVLAEAGLTLQQLDGLAFGRGPGAFTGVRIATSVVQGLAFGADLPVAPVSSLAALAQGAQRQFGAERVVAALDARMNEIYWGAYERDATGLMVEAGVEQVGNVKTLSVPAGAWFGVGSGFVAYGAELRARMGAALSGLAPECLPRARDVAMLGAAVLARGAGVSADQALPVYLRDNVVQAPGG